MPYRFRGDIARADIAFDAWGESLEELFIAAAQATMEVMVHDLSAIRPLVTVETHLEQSDQEMLLFDFLNDLIFYKDARRLLLLPLELSITATGTYALHAVFKGEEIDAQRHRLSTDVKAVTMHRFSVRQELEGWQATVVLDV